MAINYGFGSCRRQLVLHVEVQSTVSDPDCLKKGKKEGYLVSTVRRFFIDYDRSTHLDAGYSGWVQFPSGDFCVVQYVTEDAHLWVIFVAI